MPRGKVDSNSVDLRQRVGAPTWNCFSGMDVLLCHARAWGVWPSDKHIGCAVPLDGEEELGLKELTAVAPQGGHKGIPGALNLAPSVMECKTVRCCVQPSLWLEVKLFLAWNA